MSKVLLRPETYVNHGEHETVEIDVVGYAILVLRRRISPAGIVYSFQPKEGFDESRWAPVGRPETLADAEKAFRICAPCLS